MDELMRRTRLRKYIDVCLRLADSIAMADKDEANNLMLKLCGCGSAALTHSLREGAAELLHLMSSYEDMCHKAKIEEEDANRARDFIEDIFGDRFFDEMDESIVQAIKAKLKPLNLHEEVDRLCDENADGK